MSDRPQLGIILSELGHLAGPGELHRIVDFARAAEEAGFDGVFLGEHVVMGPNAALHGEPEPHEMIVPFRCPPRKPWVEPLTTLAAIASATATVRLGTSILIAPLRQPVLLAKQAATVDVLSQGRLELGIGTSWQEEEYDALGVPFTERGPRLDEALGVLEVLWRGSPAAFDGRSISFDELYCEPRPVRGTIPLWFAGKLTRRAIRRITSVGVGWCPIPPITIEDGQPTITAAAIEQSGVLDDIARLREEILAAGRDPSELDIVSPLPARYGDDGWGDLPSSIEPVGPLAASGYRTFIISPNAFLRRDDQLLPFLDEVRQRFDEVAG